LYFKLLYTWYLYLSLLFLACEFMGKVALFVPLSRGFLLPVGLQSITDEATFLTRNWQRNQLRLDIRNAGIILKWIEIVPSLTWYTHFTKTLEQTAFVWCNTKQVYSVNCPHMNATCFGLYLGHPQTRQRKKMYRKIQ
jgi:hypothetical protein